MLNRNSTRRQQRERAELAKRIAHAIVGSLFGIALCVAMLGVAFYAASY